jgi:hypothetical protein
VGHKFQSTAAAATERDRRKMSIAFFTFYDFLSVKNMVWAKKFGGKFEV